MTRLALFPLEVVLYPGEQLPLHIHEDRYKQLVRDCLEEDIPLGIVLFQGGKMKDVGCTARIVEVTKRYDDGSSDILVEGSGRFRIEEVFRDKAYMSAEVQPLSDTSETAESGMKERLIAQHIKLLELAGRTPSPSLYEDRERISFFVAHNAGLTLDQKQRVLELLTEGDRISYLVRHLNEFIPAVEEAETIRQKVQTNGHFKDFPPEI